MLEIAFNDSVGSLKAALHYGTGEYCSAVSFAVLGCANGSGSSRKEMIRTRKQLEKEQRKLWEEAVPLGGNTEEVFGFQPMLSMGYLSGDYKSGRREIAEILSRVFPKRFREEFLKRQDMEQQALQIVREHVLSGKQLRLWYSHQPDELCGMYWFISLLKTWGAAPEQVFSVEVPLEEQTDDGVLLRRNGCSELAPHEWQRCAIRQKQVTSLEMQTYDARWQELKKENSFLRAEINGRLVSVPENFYDAFIVQEIEAEEEIFNEGSLIARVLSKYQFGISDEWIAFRIDKMIESGLVSVVSLEKEEEPVYQRKLRKRKRGNENGQ